MHLPGFSAEASLHKRNILFYAAGPKVARADLGVLAQMRIVVDPVGQCYSWCFLNGGSPLQCFFACGPGQLSGLSEQLTTGFIS